MKPDFPSQFGKLTFGTARMAINWRSACSLSPDKKWNPRSAADRSSMEFLRAKKDNWSLIRTSDRKKTETKIGLIWRKCGPEEENWWRETSGQGVSNAETPLKIPCFWSVCFVNVRWTYLLVLFLDCLSAVFARSLSHISYVGPSPVFRPFFSSIYISLPKLCPYY